MKSIKSVRPPSKLLAGKDKLDRYTFEILEFDKDKVVTLTATLRTKPITAKRAGELLLEERAKIGKSNYCYSVTRNGSQINPKDLK